MGHAGGERSKNQRIIVSGLDSGGLCFSNEEKMVNRKKHSDLVPDGH